MKKSSSYKKFEKESHRYGYALYWLLIKGEIPHKYVCHLPPMSMPPCVVLSKITDEILSSSLIEEEIKTDNRDLPNVRL